MRIYVPASMVPVNTKFITGHVYQHNTSGNIYLCGLTKIAGEDHLISLSDGYIYRIQGFIPENYMDITANVALTEAKQ